MDRDQLNELLYQALETEIGGQAVYLTALDCAQHPGLRKEWRKYLEETTQHEVILRELFAELGMDPNLQTPGRAVLREKALGLVTTMRKCLNTAGPAAAQLCAAESVVEAETKDHQNWELIGQVAKAATGKLAASLQKAYDQVEDQEDEHLYHTMGWARELWLKALGLPAVLPPPEEKQHVTSMAEAARAKEARKVKV
jgi:hypothetical protein